MKKNNMKDGRFIQPTGMIIGGLIMMIIGVYLASAIFSSIFLNLHADFLMLVKYFGLLTFIQGGFILMRGLIGNQKITLHQVIMTTQVILTVSSILMLAYLYSVPEIIPFLSFQESNGVHVASSMPINLSKVQLALAIIIVLSVVGILSDMFKIGKMEKYK